MPNPPSATGRILDDDMPAPHGTGRPRPTVVPQSVYGGPPQPDPQRPPPPGAAAVPLQPAQRACYEALGLALQEGHVFAAVTGPEGSGKTTVLEAVLADRHDRALRCIRISDPDKVPARLASQIEQVAYSEAAKPENLERHVVLAIDDAHTASNELLGCLARLAAMREPGRRVPQVLLVGRPELWNRLATETYAPLARRLAIRAVLPTLQDEQDPWASLEQEVSQTMSQLRNSSEHLPVHTADANLFPLYDHAYSDNYPTTIEEAGLPFDPARVPPPTDYALFPDPPPSAPERHRESKRLLLPLGCLMAAVAAFTFVLSFFDWPSLLDGMSWADTKPAATFAFDAPSNPPSMPQTPAWAQPAQRSAQTALPRGAPPAPDPAQTAAAHPVTPPPVTPEALPPHPAAVAPAAEHVETPPKPAEPAPVAVAAPVPLPAESAKPAEAPKPVETAVKPPELPKPVVTAAAEPTHTAPPPAPAVPPPAVLPPGLATSTAAPEPAKPTPTVAEPVKPSPAAEPPARVAALAAPPLATPPLAATAPRSHRAAPIAVVRPAPLPPAIVGLLLRRGDEQLAIGDVSAARLLFERAAESGNAVGAFRLARTYDPSFLPAADAPTLGNRSQARIWYGRAAALGNHEAASRLRDLNVGR